MGKKFCVVTVNRSLSAILIMCKK